MHNLSKGSKRSSRTRSGQAAQFLGSLLFLEPHERPWEVEAAAVRSLVF